MRIGGGGAAHCEDWGVDELKIFDHIQAPCRMPHADCHVPHRSEQDHTMWTALQERLGSPERTPRTLPCNNAWAVTGPSRWLNSGRLNTGCPQVLPPARQGAFPRPLAHGAVGWIRCRRAAGPGRDELAVPPMHLLIKRQNGSSPGDAAVPLFLRCRRQSPCRGHCPGGKTESEAAPPRSQTATVGPRDIMIRR